VADGLVFPDRTPSPGLLELKKVVEPVRMTGTPESIRIENHFDFRDLSHLAFPWTLEEEGVARASGELHAGPLPAGAVAELPLPTLPPVSGEAWLTVRAVLAGDEPWAPAGHEVAWGQVPIAPAAPSRAQRRRAAAGVIALGDAAFDPVTGVLRRLGGLELIGPRLDVWRAPTDNDEGYHGPEKLAALWRRRGLDRMRHRTIEVREDDAGLRVRTRVAPAATDLALDAVYAWTAEDDALTLALEVAPRGAWDVPLPRLGVRFAVPAALQRVEWFGRGPGEAYPDTRLAARVGRFARTVPELQAPYLMPQENGSRTEVRWAELTGGAGAGLRLEGAPHFELTARPWTSEALAAARHQVDLVPDPEWIWVNADLAHNGIGSASCGPGVLPQYRLEAGRAAFRLRLRALR
jgi:beta-galactosidase